MVRIQSSNVINSQNNLNDDCTNGFSNNRGQSRALNPPDVSLLTSNLNSSKPQNTLDLCSSLGSNSSIMCFNNNSMKINARPMNVASNSSIATANNISIFNNLSNSLSSSGSTNNNANNLNNNHTNKHESSFQSNSLGNNINPIPSTSNGISSINNMNFNSPFSKLEHRINTLIMEKRMLQDKLCEREKQISDLQRIHSTSSILNDNNRHFEESIGRRIETTLERIESNLNMTISNLTNRVEQLELKIPKISSPIVNEMMDNEESPINNINGNTNGPNIHMQIDQLFQQFKQARNFWIYFENNFLITIYFLQEQRQQRRETLQSLSVILNQALQEINKLK